MAAILTSQSSADASAAPAPPPRIYDIYSWRARSPNARLVYIRDVDTANAEVSKLRTGVFGFDLEWKPNYIKGERENPVAVVQLGCADTVLLIQVSAMRTFPEKLRELLEDDDIIKTGVGIQHDCKKLYMDYAVNTRSCVDLSLLARTVDNARWKGKYTAPIGLARLCETYEELTLSKGKVQRSNWEARLGAQQQDYAANDAHSAFVIYRHLVRMLLKMQLGGGSAPLARYYTFDYINGLLRDPTTGASWNIENPNYDPGPPPPPPPPKPESSAVDGEKKLLNHDRRPHKRTGSAHAGDEGPARRVPMRSPDGLVLTQMPMHTQSASSSTGGRGRGRDRGRGRGGAYRS